MVARHLDFTDTLTVELLKTDFSDEWVRGGSDCSDDLNPELLDHMFGTWKITVPLSTLIELERVLEGKFTTQSPTPSNFYIPSEDDNITSTPLRRRDLKPLYAKIRGHLEYGSEEAFDRYEELVQSGVAPNIAVMALPLNTVVSSIVTVSAKNLLDVSRVKVSEESQLVVRGFIKTFNDYAPESYGLFQ